MSDSILTSIKEALGITEENKDFDNSIIMFINTTFMTLNQLGVGPSNGFKIQDDTINWEQYITDDDDLEAVKSYMYLKVKLLFDPSLSSVVTESMNRQITEFEHRILINTESKK